MNNKIAFIGAGKMVSAIVKSLISSGTFVADEISCCSANDGTSEALSKETGISRFESVDQLLQSEPNILVLGCKPQQFAELPNDVANLSKDMLILSIMAGITLARLDKSFPYARNIVRSMPNTPGQVGSGITGYLFASQAAEKDQISIQKVLSSLGEVREVSEEIDIDRVTAISGSGPAYIFEFTCAMEKLEKKLG